MTTPNRPAPAGLAPGMWPAHLPRPQAPVAPAAPKQPKRGKKQANEDESQPTTQDVAQSRMPWVGVKWTVVYVGLLGYVLAVTTYFLPIGDVSMAIALVGLLTQRDRFRIPGLLSGLGLFLVWCVIGYAVTRDPDLVWARLQVVGKLWVIGLVAANALRTRANIRFFMVFWLACFAFFPVRGALFNYYIYHETLYGRAAWNFIYSNPNDLAAYCILQMGMTLSLLSMEKRGPSRLGAIAGLIVVPLVIMLTKSRGAFLGFAAFVLFVLMGHRKRVQAILITVLAAGLVVFIAPKGTFDRVEKLESVKGADDLQDADEEGSAVQRYEIWKVARLIIRENPVIGVGLGAYPAMHSRYARRSQFLPTAMGRRDTHSTYLNLIAETGFIGFFIYIMSYIATLLRINTVRRRAKKVLPHTSQALYVVQCGVLAFFTAGIFGSMAHVSFLLLAMVIGWALADVATREMDAMDAERRAIAYGRGPHVAARPVTG